MKKLLKVLFIVLGILLVIAGAIALLSMTRMNVFLQRVVVQQLSRAYDTRVTVGSVSVDLVRERVEIGDLTVFNPPSFRNTPAMHCGAVKVLFDLRSIFSKEPTIRAVSVEDVDVHLRYELGEGTNLGVLARRAADRDRALVKSDKRKTDREATGNDRPESENDPLRTRREWVIEEFRCNGAKVHVSANLLPFTALALNLAPFKLEELTEDRTPASIPKVAGIFVRSVMLETLTLKGLLRPVLKPLVSRLRDEAESLF